MSRGHLNIEFNRTRPGNIPWKVLSFWKAVLYPSQILCILAKMSMETMVHHGLSPLSFIILSFISSKRSLAAPPCSTPHWAGVFLLQPRHPHRPQVAMPGDEGREPRASAHIDNTTEMDVSRTPRQHLRDF